MVWVFEGSSLRDHFFEHPKQVLKLVDGRISPFFEQRRKSNWNLAFILMIENMLWMFKRIASVRRFFRAPKTNVEID